MSVTSLELAAQMLVPGKAPQVRGLDASTQSLLDETYRVWAVKQTRNRLRESYLDGKAVMKNLEIAIPQYLADLLDVVVGWPEKAVYALAQRCVFDGLVSPGSDDDPLGLRQVLDENRFEVEFPQAIVSSMAHSTSFVETARGRESDEPDVLVMMHSAIWSGALWSRPKRALRAFLAINEVDNLGRPTVMTLSTPFQTLVLRKGAQWYLDEAPTHRLGRVPVEALPFRPTLTRPFGRSRINRRVMSLTDRAVRASLRMDVGGELHTAPKYMLMGADDSLFRDTKGNPIPLWTWYLTRMNTISKDEDGDIPTLEKIAAESPEPHVATLRQLGMEFSGETSIPLGSLGIATDNPSSASAINEVREDLIIDARDAIRVFEGSLRRVRANIVMLRDGLSEPPEELRSIRSRWLNPSRPSTVSQSDAMVKQIAAIPWLAESTVALEELGYTDEQITRLLADKRRAEGGRMLDRILSAGAQQQEAAPVDEAAVDAVSE